MSAADATLTEALTLLRNDWAEVTDRVLRDEYGLWIGSAISRERFPDVKALMCKLLVQLYESGDPSDSDCPYMQTLAHIVEMSTASNVDMLMHPNSWDKDDRAGLLDDLWSKYSTILNLGVDANGAFESVRWDILKLDEIYGDASVQPDAEHRFLALLVQEGVVTQMVTANWDALIELAHEYCCTDSDPTIHVVASNDELDAVGTGTQARLLKIHGCARKMLQDPDKYKRYMVATQPEITRWQADPYFDPLKEAARTLLRERAGLFIGLSAQDFNLQVQLASTALHRPPFDINPPRVVFTDTELKDEQKNLLQSIYGEDIYQNHRNEIEGGAALPLYAKPLLGSLYVLTILEKARCLLRLGEAHFDSYCKDLVESGINRFEEFLRARYDAVTDSNERWRKLAQELPTFMARFLSLYRKQEVLSTDEAYESVHSQDIARMELDPNIVQLDYHWLLLALAVLHEGVHRNLWSLEAPAGNEGVHGQMVLAQPRRRSRVFILHDCMFGIGHLIDRGFLEPDNADDVVIVYPHGSEPKQPVRTPRRSLPGRKSSDYTEMWLQNLVEDADTTDDLIEELRIELT